jgi:hypothetical protein
MTHSQLTGISGHCSTESLNLTWDIFLYSLLQDFDAENYFSGDLRSAMPVFIVQHFDTLEQRAAVCSTVQFNLSGKSTPYVTT